MEIKETAFVYSERVSKNQPFDKRLIEHVIALIREGVPRRDIMEKYGVTKGTLINWVHRYCDNEDKLRRYYSVLEKRSVVRAVESGMSFRQAQIAFNISHPSLIRSWMKQFKEENTELSSSNLLEMAKKITDDSEKLELKALQKALEAEILKNRALNTMIDIAEQQLKIDIRKKSGARQSSK